VGGIQNVIAFLPPVPTSTKKAYLVYLRRSDIAAELKQAAREVRVIDQTTEPRLYTFGVTRAPQGDLVFVLAPITA
jgi:hypothetical protein